MKTFYLKRILLLSLTAFFFLSSFSIRVQAKESGEVYGIGSVSKMYGTAAMMKLAEQGEVNLDSPVTDYIPEFVMADERYTNITVRMLLNHSSGIMGTTFNNCFLVGESTVDYHALLLENLKTQQLKAAPGEYSVYCNDGFTLAEIIIERVSGMSFGEFIRKEFSVPLGLNNTYVPDQITKEDILSPIYFNNRPLPYENIQSIASGGIYSTPADVCLFSQIFMEDSGGILSQESVNAMANPEYKNDAICVQEGEGTFGYGLGWDSVNAYPYSEYGITALMKGGDTGRYHAGLTVLPQQNLSVCVTASGGSSSEGCQMAAQSIIMEVLKENNLIPDEDPENMIEKFSYSKEETTAIPENLKKYQGIYASSQIWQVSFTRENTLLLRSLENESGMVQEYIYTPEGYFVSTKGNYLSYDGPSSPANGISGITKFRFSEEPNGKTYMLGTIYMTSDIVGQTANTLPIAEKIDENQLSAAAKTVWEKRNGKEYYLVGEAYNSSYYLTMPNTKIETLDGLPGYTGASPAFKNCRIIDENNAQCELDMPILVGRDLPKYSFYQESDSEYLGVNSYTFISEDSLLPSLELTGSVTVGDKGIWYSVDSEDAGREIQIQVPKDSAYYVYDKEDICLASSIFTDEKQTVFLPENGKVLLVGKTGSTFVIKR